jgi:anti-anti-sigma factor
MHYSMTDYNNAKVLRVQGELDALSCPELRPILDALTRDDRCRIVVDLSEVKVVDCSGVGFLVSLYKRAREKGESVSFVGVTDQPLRLFRLLRLDHVFVLTPNESKAAA